MIGQTISHYKILEKLGEGGMGVVYKAEDTRLKRAVALKLLPKRLSIDTEERERFTLEAQAASALNHPNICTIYEINESDGETFIAMEYIEGTTLGAWIRSESARQAARPREAVNSAVRIALQTAEGLAKAHEKGIVHRDIKPDNIMVTGDELRVKIMDFGLAKLQGVSKLTRTGSTVGTVAYMSPEQAEGADTDHRTDIFSFGVLCYELFTGRLPFHAAHETAIIYEIMNVQPEPPSSLNHAIDAELDRIVMKCLEKNRDDRYQSMKEAAVDLNRYLRDSSGRVAVGAPASVSGAGRSGPRSSGPTAPGGSSGQSGSGRPAGLKLAAGVAVLALAIAAGWFYFSGKDATPGSLAVLPFVNGTGEADKEYLTEGLTDNVINKLSKLSRLRVIPRSMAGRYAGKDVDPRAAGKDLGVDAVLTGKVVQRGDGLSVQAELIDIGTVSQIWGERYERKLSDLIAVQDDIVKSVTDRLGANASETERRNMAAGKTSNAEAYQLYLKGRFYWNKRTAENGRKALEYFEQAIAVDPNYALGYAGVADGYLVGATGTPPSDYMPKVRAAAKKALELDENLAEAHATMAMVNVYYEFDFASAEKELRRAIELNANYPTIHHWLGEFLVFMGRFDEGFAAYAKASELDPLSLAIDSDYGIAYFLAGQYDKSIEHLRKTIAADPKFVRSHFYIVYPLLKKGMKDEAFNELLKGLKARGDSAAVIEDVRKAYGRAGFRGIAELEITRGARFDEESRIFDMSVSYLAIGDKEAAIDFLEKSYEERQYHVVTIKVDPTWDELRKEPRFIALLKKVGF